MLFCFSYPLHEAVFRNDIASLSALLRSCKAPDSQVKLDIYVLLFIYIFEYFKFNKLILFYL